MKSVVKWAIEHTPTMNTIMVVILLVGVFSGWMLRREEFPQFDLELILVSVPYPGASPEEVETGICQKIEESIRSVDGIKKVTSVAMEGAANVVVEVRTDVPDVQRVLSEIQSEIDRIPSFPDLAEEPEVQQVTLRNPAITVGIIAPDSEQIDADLQLRAVVEEIRDDLLEIPQVSVADIVGERKYQIDVEIPEQTLREYGLNLTDVATRIRARNLELPGGNIRAKGETFLVRAKDKKIYGEEIAKIPLITQQNGVVITVGDLGIVKDEFIDTTSISRINGEPGLAITMKAGATEDLLALTESVNKYVAETELPYGYKFTTWGDVSIDVRDRLDLLTRNGLQGLLLVFIILALFLEFRLAFWVAMGIPISILGACIILWQFDQTLNMLSMFAFLIALGIVVDDAIVVGENIYAHRQMGKPFHQAAIDGTFEVLPSVTTSVTTTIFAFMPMFFVTGIMGKFFAVLPVAVVAMLVISLFESVLILPCHLSHGGGKTNSIGTRINKFTNKILEFVIQRIYLPVLKFCLNFPMISVSGAIFIVLVSVTLVMNGTVQSDFFPKLDAPVIQAAVTFPDGTPSRITDAATKKIETAIQIINKKYSTEDQPLVLITHRMVGSSPAAQGPGAAMGGGTDGGHTGYVYVQLVGNEFRSITSNEVAQEWREAVGPIPGVETLTFGSQNHGPGGKAIEFKLLAPPTDMHKLEEAIEDSKVELAKYPGVQDISDDSRPGKWEIQLTEKERGTALGVPLEAVARTVRAAYYGEEVMRLQRGRHEVKLMVRYPEEDRESLASLDEIRVDSGDGIRRPITELANVSVSRGYSEINRIDQRRSITVSADLDGSKGNSKEIINDLKAKFIPQLLKEYPSLRIRWEGQQEQDTESMGSLKIGLAVAMFATFVLLTMEFNSYGQPLIVMSIIPFGIIGAIWGHAIMGLPLTLFSMLGLVALTGVVVNDSIVLVDFINARVRAGVALKEAAIEAGQRRFRPVLLTSLTTVAGLLPILTEKSFQAQLVIPMATSLCFGLLFATALVLLLIPTFYVMYANVFGVKTHDEISVSTTPKIEEEQEELVPQLQTS
ncbi:MAG: efflux RND transporter permease subunit [Planctomicrobium sp.]|jgi:hydrophobic/amphiphilic exporter-1 (mainly G- bacteria), HAE1 family|nr:efflux RND transporter permease subunit [Planctomicrobium sp.]